MSKNKINPFAVACVRSMENKLLSQQKLMQMAEAKSGYWAGILPPLSPSMQKRE